MGAAVLGLVGLALGCQPEPDEPVLNEEYYGPCFDDSLRTICREDEAFCSTPDNPNVLVPDFSVCGATCDVADDCPEPESGDAPAQCIQEGCVLQCAGGQTCPDGMQCGEGSICMWPRE